MQSSITNKKSVGIVSYDNNSSKLHQQLDTQKRRANNRKSKKTTKNRGMKRGRWEINEKKAFLRGFLTYGRGKWKEIAKLIPQR